MEHQQMQGYLSQQDQVAEGLRKELEILKNEAWSIDKDLQAKKDKQE